MVSNTEIFALLNEQWRVMKDTWSTWKGGAVVMKRNAWKLIIQQQQLIKDIKPQWLNYVYHRFKLMIIKKL